MDAFAANKLSTNTNVGTQPRAQCDNDVVFVIEEQTNVFGLPVPVRRLKASRSLSTLHQRDGSRSPSRSSTPVSSPPEEYVSLLDCPVCLGPANDPSCTKCGHIFCDKCIRATLRVSRKCPICKKGQLMKNLRRLYV